LQWSTAIPEVISVNGQAKTWLRSAEGLDLQRLPLMEATGKEMPRTFVQNKFTAMKIKLGLCKLTLVI
jgi:hypothetical protein